MGRGERKGRSKKMELQLIMKKIQFNYDLWVNNQDKYELVTRDGSLVELYKYEPRNLKQHQIIGSAEGCARSWDINGYFNSEFMESYVDLMMVEKKQTKTYKEIVVAVRYPNSRMVNMEVCPLDDRDAIEDSYKKKGFDYQIKEIEFEF